MYKVLVNEDLHRVGEHLNAHEFRALHWLIGATIGWGRLNLSVTYRQMMTGGHHDNRKLRPLKITHTVLRTSIASLERLGCISREVVSHNGITTYSTYTVHIDTDPKGFPMIRLAIPNRLQNHSEAGQDLIAPLADLDSPPCQDLIAPLSGSDTQIPKKAPKKEPMKEGLAGFARQPSLRSARRSSFSSSERRDRLSPVETVPPAPAKLPVRTRTRTRLGPLTAPTAVEAEATAMQPAAAAQGAGIAKKNKERVDAIMDSISTIWVRTYNETFPDDTAATKPSARHLHAFYDRHRRWDTARLGEFVNFVKWSVRNWAEVVHAHFGWMRSPPAPRLPDARFFLRWQDDFAGDYMERRTAERRWEKPWEQALYERLVMAGKGPDVAREEVVAQRERRRAADALSAKDAKIALTNRECETLRLQNGALQSRLGLALRHQGQSYRPVARTPPNPEAARAFEDLSIKIELPTLPAWEEGD